MKLECGHANACVRYEIQSDCHDKHQSSFPRSARDSQPDVFRLDVFRRLKDSEVKMWLSAKNVLPGGNVIIMGYISERSFARFQRQLAQGVRMTKVCADDTTKYIFFFLYTKTTSPQSILQVDMFALCSKIANQTLKKTAQDPFENTFSGKKEQC